MYGFLKNTEVKFRSDMSFVSTPRPQIGIAIMIMIKRAISAICGVLIGISMIHAEIWLEELIQGTSTTPELSGLQISLMETENYQKSLRSGSRKSKEKPLSC